MADNPYGKSPPRDRRMPPDRRTESERRRPSDRRADPERRQHPDPTPPIAPAEMKYHGAAACLAIWRKRPDEIIRAYVDETRVAEFGELLKTLAANRRAYHLVTADELERITETTHHQGICLLALEHRRLPFSVLRSELQREGNRPRLLLYLDGVENPHNLGAILRSCAHFGISHCLGREGELPRLAASAVRVAEGGAEAVTLVASREPEVDIAGLREMGFEIAATAGRGGDSLYRHRFAPRTLLIMGAEVSGVSTRLAGQAERLLQIPGTGAVESLNVSVASALLLGEFYRQHQGEASPQRGRGGRRPGR